MLRELIDKLKDVVDQYEGSLDPPGSLANTIDQNRADLAGAVVKELEEAQKEIEMLKEDSDFLRLLQAHGVDNWPGYEEACRDREEGSI